ncbi:MAG: 3,4-dihydroxy-2-butanone-4-phosphate synthase [Phycisphaeraceae bacterium]|nr:3,4-dihydroxy-2-butanone-4-phosphate synthase [Phycisphaeraceae bacterium]
MTPIPDILAELAAGRMIVLVDDEKRENEGDLVLAAEHATPGGINFMLREGRGMMCVALAGELCDRLDLQPQTSHSTALRSTAYTVTVDAASRFGISTGVSAADRATTIRLLTDEKTLPHDLARPGHTQPLRARDGGSLVRAGQTEGAIDLCKMAGLRPAAVIIEVMNDDGTMARRDDLARLCEKHQLKMCSVADVIEHRLSREKLIERIAEAPFENELGTFTLIAYRSQTDPFPHVALVCGDVGSRQINEPVLVRMHSQNLLGDVFGDLTQPTHKTLWAALTKIQKAGRGAVVYLRHDRGGTGLLQQLHTALLRNDDPERLHLGERHPTPGSKPPTNVGAYGIGCQILRDLGISRLKLLTNHPFTPTALAGFGLSIEQFVPVDD